MYSGIRVNRRRSQPKSLRASSPFLPLLWLLFAASGCAALIYEIVWLQLLELVIGSSAVSLGVLLGTFMGGLCLGSIGLAWVVAPGRHPLRVYALIELGIGILGVAVLLGLPAVSRLYLVNSGHGSAGILWRAAVAAMCLVPPTLLMGASLPAAARWLEATPDGIAWLGFLYGGNLAGSVFGCLLAGFYLLRVHDLPTATCTAAAINAAVAAAALVLSTRAPGRAPPPPLPPGSAANAPGAWGVLGAIALSGFCALGAEVVWTRLLSLLIGGTVYTFSIILAIFLAGLGTGSGAGSWLSRRLRRPRLALASSQFLLAAAIAFAAWVLAEVLPYWRVPPDTDPWSRFQLDFGRCLCAILPAACLWGASFPLALAGAARPGQDAGRLVGRVYAANTVGAILGSLAFSLLLLPEVGSQDAQRLLVALSATAALAALAPSPGRFRGAKAAPPRWRAAAALAAWLALAAVLAWALPPVPWGVIAWGHHLLPSDMSSTDLLYLGEGRNASIAITQRGRIRSFHINGKVEASAEPQDMRLQRMLGHIPALLHPGPRSVLIVGCGAGVTAGTFVLHPTVERIVICEIEPLVPAAVARFFDRENYNVVRDPRTQVVYDDARHYILTTRDKFDIITSDPVHPWVKGSATLYTKEYFELCRQHLNPGGVITQWVPLYQNTLETVKSEMATFFDIFPQGTVWSNETPTGEDDDVVLLGRETPVRIDVDALERRLDRADHAAVAASLREVGFDSAAGLLATYAGCGPDLRPWLRDAQINRDRNLRLQYLAGMRPDLQEAPLIYEQMLRYRKSPRELPTGPALNPATPAARGSRIVPAR